MSALTPPSVVTAVLQLVAQQVPLSPARCAPSGGRGAPDPIPIPRENLELGGDPRFSQAPTHQGSPRAGDPAGSMVLGGLQGAPHFAMASRTLAMPNLRLCWEMTGLRAWVKKFKNQNGSAFRLVLPHLR